MPYIPAPPPTMTSKESYLLDKVRKAMRLAAEKRASSSNIHRAEKEFNHDVNTFLAGSEYLIPLLVKAIEQRDLLIRQSGSFDSIAETQDLLKELN